MHQCLLGLEHMHSNGIFHRDIKPENILLTKDRLKLADFGSCRGIYSKPPLTEYISTRWYRAPECLLTNGAYTQAMDIWSTACVFFEMATLCPLFPGESELDQLDVIHSIVGTPAPRHFEAVRGGKFPSPHVKLEWEPVEGKGIRKYLLHMPPEFSTLLEGMLAYAADDRLSAQQSLAHPFFDGVRERRKARRSSLPGEMSSMGSLITPPRCVPRLTFLATLLTPFRTEARISGSPRRR